MKTNPSPLALELEAQGCCGRGNPLERAKRGLPTVAALLIALASSLVMTLAG